MSLVSVTHLILRFANVQNKIQQTNKAEINHIIENHIKFEVSLHFWRSGLLCAADAVHTVEHDFVINSILCGCQRCLVQLHWQYAVMPLVGGQGRVGFSLPGI